MTMLRNRPLFRLLSLALIPLLLSACATWQQQDPPLAPHVEKGPDKVRITLADGRVVKVTRPRLANDSIVGEVFPDDGAGFAFGEPLDQVIQLELHERDSRKTALAIAGAASLVGIAIWIWYSCAKGACFAT